MCVYSIIFFSIIIVFVFIFYGVMSRENPALCIYENKKGTYPPVNNRSLICKLVFAALRFLYVRGLSQNAV